MIILSILFFVTAILYASVGFGGGSTYLALLLLWGVPYFIFNKQFSITGAQEPEAFLPLLDIKSELDS